MAASDRAVELAARSWAGDLRSADELREHYEIERELAARLRRASAQERTGLYAAVYDELFRRVPSHPQLRRRSSRERALQVDRELYFLGSCLEGKSTFLEIGAGDLALATRVAELVEEVHAVDVASEIADVDLTAANLHTYLIDGCRLPLADESIALAYSNQLMEHLHPDDAAEQLREVFRVLKPGGSYLCVTPNRLTGPWDISRMFDSAPSGLHLCEYSNRELAHLLSEVGFKGIRALVPAGRTSRQLPAALFAELERALEVIGQPARGRLLRGPLGKPLHSVRLLARKPPV